MKEFYPYALKFHNTKVFLCWCSSEVDHDYFLKNSDGHLVFFNEFEEISAYRINNLLDVFSAKDIAEINFDDFFKIINGSWVKELSSDQYSLILDGFNLLEDLVFTLNPKLMRLFEAKKFVKVMNKLFYASDLPSVTPKGKSYIPIWDQNEIEHIKRVVKEVWAYIIENDPAFEAARVRYNKKL